MDQNNIEKIRNILEESKNIVLVSGSEVANEAGFNGLRAEHIVYDIEEKYGYSGEEIVTSQIYSRQVDLFFDYYKEVILNRDEPTDTTIFDIAAKLEKYGKLKSIVTRMVYDFYQDAGCENVVDLYGSVEENRCPACGKVFDSRYIKKAKGTPKCDACQVILRPGFTFFGELVDNTRLTRAANAIENASGLLVLGIPLKSQAWQSMLRYYEGNKLILINTEEKNGDDRADYCVYGDIAEILKEVTDFEYKEEDRIAAEKARKEAREKKEKEEKAAAAKKKEKEKKKAGAKKK